MRWYGIQDSLKQAKVVTRKWRRGPNQNKIIENKVINLCRIGTFCFGLSCLKKEMAAEENIQEIVYTKIPIKLQYPIYNRIKFKSISLFYVVKMTTNNFC